MFFRCPFLHNSAKVAADSDNSDASKTEDAVAGNKNKIVKESAVKSDDIAVTDGKKNNKGSDELTANSEFNSPSS